MTKERRVPSVSDRLDVLETEVDLLRDQVAELKSTLPLRPLTTKEKGGG